MRLFVVMRKPPESSVRRPSRTTMTPQPPGPGLGEAAPSARITVVGSQWVERVAPFGVHVFVEKPFAASLADAVVRLLRDSKRRTDLAALGRKRSVRWNPVTMAAGVLAAYDGLTQPMAPAREAV